MVGQFLVSSFGEFGIRVGLHCMETNPPQALTTCNVASAPRSTRLDRRRAVVRITNVSYRGRTRGRSDSGPRVLQVPRGSVRISAQAGGPDAPGEAPPQYDLMAFSGSRGPRGLPRHEAARLPAGVGDQLWRRRPGHRRLRRRIMRHAEVYGVKAAARWAARRCSPPPSTRPTMPPRQRAPRARTSHVHRRVARACRDGPADADSDGPDPPGHSSGQPPRRGGAS